MSTDKDTIQGILIGSALDIARELVAQRVSFTFHSPSECADGKRRWQFETYDAAGVCVLSIIKERARLL